MVLEVERLTSDRVLDEVLKEVLRGVVGGDPGGNDAPQPGRVGPTSARISSAKTAYVLTSPRPQSG